jgi:eukaryotic-like serine/threonine-protein kinase
VSDTVELGGRYRLERKIGEGGMGQVYLGVDTRLGRSVAVKVLPRSVDSDPEGVKRFMREARLAATLQHPGITVVHDIDVDDSRPNDKVLYLVMELLAGDDLGKIIERGLLPLDLAIDLAIQIAEALAAAHAQGVIHRDLKPANVMVVEGNRAKICDFGIARHMSSATGLTGSGVLGTPVYMAPEQFLGHQIEARTDLYLLGGVFNEIFGGQPPFPIDEGIEALVQGHLKHQPRGPQASNRQVPDEIQRLVLDMLAKSPADRPADAKEVARRLKAVRVVPFQAGHPNAGHPHAGHQNAAPDEEFEKLSRRAARYCHEGRFVDAVTAANQAIQGRQRLFGPEHPSTLSSQNILASALYMLGRGLEAEAVARMTAQARSRAHGPEHPKTLRSWLLLAKILYTIGRAPEALQIAQGVARDRARLMGLENVETLEARNTEGWALNALGRNPEALPVAYETATTRGRVLGNDHHDTLDSRLLLGRVQHALGQLPQAHAVASALVQDCMRVLGPAHPQTAKAQAMLNSFAVPAPYYR